MTEQKNDVLLLAGKVLAFLMQVAMGIGGAALIVAIAGLVLFHDEALAQIAAETGAAESFPIYLLIGVMLIGLGIVAALFAFFARLRQIIDTVGAGDPFDPVNAERLNMMAWLMLAANLLFIPAAAIGVPLVDYFDAMEGADVSIEQGIDLTGILLIIILFILARVFRHGAAMRADLEGTV